MKEILFAYDEPAAVVKEGRKRYLVVGDLHIGKELKLAGKGIKIYGTSDLMADRILSLLKYNRAKILVLLGDVKDSIIRPDSVEMRIIDSFFRKLSGYPIILVQGNHDAGIGERQGVAKVKEYRIGNVGMIHGNALPSEELMGCDYLIAGHDHPAIRNPDGSIEKAWVTMDVNHTAVSKIYAKPNRKMKLILMPAFNDLIVGGDIKEGRILNPLVRRGVFKRRSAKIYTVKGQLASLGF